MPLGRNSRREKHHTVDTNRAGYKLPDGRWVTLAEEQRNVPHDPGHDVSTQGDKKSTLSQRDAISILLLLVSSLIIFIGVAGLWSVWLALIVIGVMFCAVSFLMAL